MNGRSYEVRTFGCQMNVHDSERLCGLLESAGYSPVDPGGEADVVVFNTCAVRENADNRLYGNLGQLVPVKKGHPGMQIAVGGCLAQKDRAAILDRAPWVDVVFGTHNLHRLPVLLERARHNAAAQVEIAEALEVFPSSLPTRRASHHSAWVSISVGCDNTCTFCIVPSLRGRERDRRPGDVLAEVEALVAEGALEITLLGQNVNSYGRSLGDPGAFAKLLAACGRVDGLERVRFTSPHPRDFTDDVIEAMATTSNVCHQLHMPLQSGSDTVLRRMRRSYRRDRFLGIVERVRAAMPDAAITTDIIVGFPGETEADFADTLDVVRAARFSGAFTFQYSPRPGTPAATMDAQVDRATVADRYTRLVALQDEISWAENRALVGRRVEVLVSEGEGRKDGATGRMSGRARDGRLVHFRADEAASSSTGSGPRAGGAAPAVAVAVAPTVRPGDVVETVVTRAAPHHLTADGPLRSHRATRAGDAWALGRDGDGGGAAAAQQPADGRPIVTLGIPSLRPSSPDPVGPASADAASAGADACCTPVRR
ncbi:tRNA-i(6)A37 thiotransferase enzyme MiaB [Frankia casuarinae]|uniref:tRNA-2-methylthio-N(6)-dimethylallyladenosine synthase n=1 Tax=Frankia casuarinae (strain DSM 45818 / CECT 9043 / HFP020203 / CcI3) TaxID=106370 RepID=MIAB_FRACC|nr:MULTISPECIES: tRNA (N6-isopentenyl adenosine(37)-C2)-methylthiotransferase MiaB [Frankia]Q2J771.1 RecName: Full=tRNA-2-methylthio-N(6)-dimethylallyladenosine synthase; AltName: Full=(Dimethylallyl)adenosine tRNA methylthiotransferase MiaB; AltName: Full=tRNA-i(6)A37 methylthiotransferase [Frankia casuarinae]ABD12871.1 tRNA-i(6)A37 thiotransferase enzyme MiaB [Frankia casuarinae]ETA03329.1 tRNA-i(6)A37 thiotransferase enzyme MiaB [Frankia sp. CcI6]EYT92721.1 tRNA-i(6)A37 thiotransferase enzym